MSTISVSLEHEDNRENKWTFNPCMEENTRVRMDREGNISVTLNIDIDEKGNFVHTNVQKNLVYNEKVIEHAWLMANRYREIFSLFDYKKDFNFEINLDEGSPRDWPIRFNSYVNELCEKYISPHGDYNIANSGDNRVTEKKGYMISVVTPEKNIFKER